MNNLEGQRFGRLVALRPTGTDKSGGYYWVCRCDCGTEKGVLAHSLRRQLTQSCGCLQKEVARAHALHNLTYRKGNPKNLTGQSFGRLKTLKPTEKRKASFVVWFCQCSCGTYTDVTSHDLLSGHTQSCGCWRSESRIISNTTHGRSYTTEWVTYHNAKSRCNNPHVSSYFLYGGRGIKFLFTSFDEWYAELGPKPTPEHSVDRIDNDGHYEKGNVRWATKSEQAYNRRPYNHRPQ